MLQLFSKSLNADNHEGDPLFSPRKREVSSECVTPDNTVTRLYQQDTRKRRAGRYLGLWLVWGMLGVSTGGIAAIAQAPSCYGQGQVEPRYWGEYNIHSPRLYTECDYVENGITHSDVPCFARIRFRNTDYDANLQSQDISPAPFDINAGFGVNWYAAEDEHEITTLVTPHSTIRWGIDPFPIGSSVSAGEASPTRMSDGSPYYLLLSGDKDIGGDDESCQYFFLFSREAAATTVNETPMVPAAQAAGALFILFGAQEVQNNSGSPTATTGTLFNSTYPATNPLKHTFTLNNYDEERIVSVSLSEYISDQALTINTGSTSETQTLNQSGSGETDFSVSPSTLTLPAGTFGAPGQATFDISFKPGGKGLRQAVVNIDQDGENEIRFLIQGGTASPLQLRGGIEDLVIGDMDDTPEENEGTDFMAQRVNAGSATQTFTLLNTERREITVLTDLRDTNNGFNLTNQYVTVPAATDEGMGSATFDISFNPTTTGNHETFVDLNYDSERQLSFKVSGTGEKSSGGLFSPWGLLGLLGLLLASFGSRRRSASKKA